MLVRWIKLSFLHFDAFFSISFFYSKFEAWRLFHRLSMFTMLLLRAKFHKYQKLNWIPIYSASKAEKKIFIERDWNDSTLKLTKERSYIRSNDMERLKNSIELFKPKHFYCVNAIHTLKILRKQNVNRRWMTKWTRRKICECSCNIVQ